MAVYTVHAGHAKQGSPFSGAVGIVKESEENRKVKDVIVKYLQQEGYIVHDCTVDTGLSQNDILAKICAKCNAASSDLDISIHFNSGRNDSAGDTKQGGFEMYATAYTGIKKEVAERIIENMKALGFVMHGEPLKTTSGLYFLNHTKSPALLLEICFVDDKDDCNVYKNVGADAIGKAIAEAILNKKIGAVENAAQSQPQKSQQSVQSSSGKKSNQHVHDLQWALNIDGLTDAKGRKLIEDGLWGSNTEAAVSKVCLSTKTIRKYINITMWVQCRVGVSLDGLFGNKTKQAVEAFQASHNLVVDGIVGKNTIKELIKTHAPGAI